MFKLFVGLTATIVLSAAASAQTLPRIELPIRDVVLDNGLHAYSVPIKIGTSVVEAGLDTGSTGLRVFPGTLKPGDVEITGRAASYGFSSDDQYEGDTAKGVVNLGGVAAPINLETITKVGCWSDYINCPVAQNSSENYGIRGNSVRDGRFRAVLGINLSPRDVGNPLRQIGVKSWIVELPRVGDHEPGRLILNPNPEETRGFTRLPILSRYFSDLWRQKGGLHDAVSGCLRNNATGAQGCGGLVLDTGSPGISLMNGPLQVRGPTWANGTKAELAFYDFGPLNRSNGPADTGALAVLDANTPHAVEYFRVGVRAQASHLTMSEMVEQRDTIIFAGLSPYYAFEVLYEPDKDQIGLNPRPEVADAPVGKMTSIN